MIPVVWYTLGFLIYMIFCYVTFDVYSKKNENMSIFVLLFVYLFYSSLAAYVIYFVEQQIGGSPSDAFIESIVYFFLGGFLLYSYYGYIRKKDDQQSLNDSYGKL
jgi:uncharacterized membrane protein